MWNLAWLTPTKSTSQSHGVGTELARARKPEEFKSLKVATGAALLPYGLLGLYKMARAVTPETTQQFRADATEHINNMGLNGADVMGAVFNNGTTFTGSVFIMGLTTLVTDEFLKQHTKLEPTVRRKTAATVGAVVGTIGLFAKEATDVLTYNPVIESLADYMTKFDYGDAKSIVAGTLVALPFMIAGALSKKSDAEVVPQPTERVPYSQRLYASAKL